MYQTSFQNNSKIKTLTEITEIADYFGIDRIGEPESELQLQNES